jgi:hypothetical protein
VSEGPEDHRTVSRTRTWQRGDRLHDVMEIVQDGRRWRYEHEQRGDGVFRTLVDGRVDSIRADDRGWAGDEGRKGFAENLQTAKSAAVALPPSSASAWMATAVIVSGASPSLVTVTGTWLAAAAVPAGTEANNGGYGLGSQERCPDSR